MKKIVFILLGILLICTAAWAGGGKKQTAAAVITFDGQKFYLQYSAGNQQEWLNEYLPDGQDFNTYTNMLTVRSYDGVEATPMQIATAIAQNFAQNYPGIKYSLSQNKETGDGAVSFIIATDTIYECNVFRVTSQGGHPVALQYVYRVYPPQGEGRQAAMAEFSKKAKNGWPVWLQALTDMPVPTVVRTVKS